MNTIKTTGEELIGLASKALDFDLHDTTLFAEHLAAAEMFPAPDEGATPEHAANLIIAVLCSDRASRSAEIATAWGDLPLATAQYSTIMPDGRSEMLPPVMAENLERPSGSVLEIATRTLRDHLAYMMRATSPADLPPGAHWFIINRDEKDPSAITWAFDTQNGVVATATFESRVIRQNAAGVRVVVVVETEVLQAFAARWFDPDYAVSLQIFQNMGADGSAVLAQ